MRIEVDPQLMVRLMGYALATRQEFSGLGFCELRKDVIWVYDFVLFDVGSEVFTEIPVSELMKLMERPDYANMKVWLHRHPMGDGIPGAHNWSGTDESTIQLAPLGGVPELVKWSVSMVLTLGGWVGRIDNHITHKTQHLEVAPSVQPAYAEIDAIRQKKAILAQAEKERKAAERQKAVEEITEIIASRVKELPESVLQDLGIKREDLVEMALELKIGKRSVKRSVVIMPDEQLYEHQLALLRDGYSIEEIEEETGATFNEDLYDELEHERFDDEDLPPEEINQYILNQRRQNRGRSYPA